jgi:hypothetical protein
MRPVEAAQGNQPADEWRVVKASFVDDPSIALRDAESLVERVMAARGYTEGDFELQGADVSVDHPVILEHYRAAREISLSHADSHAETKDLRQAMIHDQSPDYDPTRALFSAIRNSTIRRIRSMGMGLSSGN